MFLWAEKMAKKNWASIELQWIPRSYPLRCSLFRRVMKPLRINFTWPVAGYHRALHIADLRCNTVQDLISATVRLRVTETTWNLCRACPLLLEPDGVDAAVRDWCCEIEDAMQSLCYTMLESWRDIGPATRCKGCMLKRQRWKILVSESRFMSGTFYNSGFNFRNSE